MQTLPLHIPHPLHQQQQQQPGPPVIAGGRASQWWRQCGSPLRRRSIMLSHWRIRIPGNALTSRQHVPMSPLFSGQGKRPSALKLLLRAAPLPSRLVFFLLEAWCYHLFPPMSLFLFFLFILFFCSWTSPLLCDAQSRRRALCWLSPLLLRFFSARPMSAHSQPTQGHALLWRTRWTNQVALSKQDCIITGQLQWHE